MPVHAINVNGKIIQEEKDQKKDNQERLAKEELDSRDKHHKIKTGLLSIRSSSHCNILEISTTKGNYMLSYQNVKHDVFRYFLMFL